MPAHHRLSADATRSARLLAIGADSGLRDEVLRLGAATGVDSLAIDVDELNAAIWSDSELVVIDAGSAYALASAGLPRRSDVLIVTTGRPGASLWSAAVNVGAEQVVELPAGERWLAERLSDIAGGSGPVGAVVAVIGGCGGAGATTLAGALALSAARAGHQPVLLGVDPWDGGIDIALGAEDVPGPRWPDLAGVSGRLPVAAILDGLPQAYGVRFLSSDRTKPAPVPLPALSAVVTAARRAGGPVIVDLPRACSDSARWIGGVLDLGLVVCPATVAGALASRALAAELGWNAATSGIVVRPGLGRDVDDADLTAAVGLPVMLRIDEDPHLARQRQRAAPPGPRRRSRLANSCATLWQMALDRQARAA